MEENKETEIKEENKPMDKQTVIILTVLGYFGILFIVPLIACQNNKFARFHTNQSIILFIFNVIIGVIGAILNIIHIPVISLIISFMLLAISITMFIFWILQIVAVIQEKERELPIIGKFRILN